ncbi:MAG: sigma-54 dependent transcriptional regulator [Pontixanthobacter sp.]
MTCNVLLVEDDAAIAAVIRASLSDAQIEVFVCGSIADRDIALQTGRYDVLMTDIVLGDGDGIADLPELRRTYPDMEVIILSAQNTLDTAIRATQSGAFEYFPKPFDIDALTDTVRRAARQRPNLRDEPQTNVADLPLVGRSPAMQGVYRMITRVLDNDLSVLVLGESGTGKELVAEAIHGRGHRCSGPFIAINAAAIPAELIESELFGHERGAFTGAVKQAFGKFEQANGGTLFLDEIGDMPIDAQTRLLRTLQSGRIRRVGGQGDIAIDVRIVAATHRDLQPLIENGRFREDLYYRLNVVPINLPPLRERVEDIPDLCRFFLSKATNEGLPMRRIDKQALADLCGRPWKGNVRELKNTVYRLALMARDETIDLATVAEHVATAKPAVQGEGLDRSIVQWLDQYTPVRGEIYQNALSAFERPLFRWALSQTAGNQLKAAKLLGLNRNTLRKRLSDLSIEPQDYQT